jgi:hypothetical protein
MCCVVAVVYLLRLSFNVQPHAFDLQHEGKRAWAAAARDYHSALQRPLADAGLVWQAELRAGVVARMLGDVEAPQRLAAAGLRRVSLRVSDRGVANAAAVTAVPPAVAVEGARYWALFADVLGTRRDKLQSSVAALQKASSILRWGDDTGAFDAVKGGVSVATNLNTYVGSIALAVGRRIIKRITTDNNDHANNNDEKAGGGGGGGDASSSFSDGSSDVATDASAGVVDVVDSTNDSSNDSTSAPTLLDAFSAFRTSACAQSNSYVGSAIVAL